MDNFEETVNEKVVELLKNYNTFIEKKNDSAGRRARKNAQELKNLMTEVRKLILLKQKENKEERTKKKKEKNDDE
tara:strand:+ start:85 stop:309 length:225 start_codon:yes stop_codon:yes gene_type:complete